jgi:hypothetical protein
MVIWKYIIQTDIGPIITSNYRYAEQRSKSGNIVFCKREKNIYKYF